MRYLNEQNPNYRARQTDKDGYRVRSSEVGRIAYHRMVVFETLDIDRIPTGYQIHHRDCNKVNNCPTNLVLLTASDHRWLHKEFGNATLAAYMRCDVELSTLAQWSGDSARATRILPLSILDQSGVVKSGELLGSPETGHQQPSQEGDVAKAA